MRDCALRNKSFPCRISIYIDSKNTRQSVIQIFIGVFYLNLEKVHIDHFGPNLKLYVLFLNSKESVDF
jgi:hypothetical protein